MEKQQQNTQKLLLKKLYIVRQFKHWVLSNEVDKGVVIRVNRSSLQLMFQASTLRQSK